MSANGTNGNGSNGNGSADPFAHGVWIITPLGHPNVLAMIHGSDASEAPTEEAYRKEFVENGGLGVTLLRKYVLTDLQFPLHERGANGAANGRIAPARVAAFSTHEAIIDLEHPFESDVILRTVTWVSRMHPENVARLRQTVKNIDEQADREKRMLKSNLIMPNSSAGFR